MSDITTENFVCIEQTPATIGDRIFARNIDAVVLVAYTYFALFFLDKSGIGDDTFLEVLCVIILLMPIFTYTFLSELLFDGQTLGKYVMKTRVVMADGSSPTSGALLLRFVCEIIDIYMGCMGLVVIMCTKRRQRLGDLAVLRSKHITGGSNRSCASGCQHRSLHGTLRMVRRLDSACHAADSRLFV